MIAVLCLAFSTTLLGMVVFHRLNQHKSRVCEKQGITEEKRQEYTDMGDDSPLFRFTL